MRILVNDYAGHPFELQLSRELARRGHTVLHTYFAAYQTPKGRVDDDSTANGLLTIEAVDIRQKFSQHSAISRRSADRAYGRELSRKVARFQPDVVISANTPLDAQQLLMSATRKQGAKFIFWMQDLLSSAVEFVLRKKGVPFAALAGKLYSHLERRLLRKSDAIVCIAPEFRDPLRKWGLNDEMIFVIENWAPLEEISPQPRDTAFSREQGLDGKFCFMYSGTLGMKHKPELLLKMAQHFGDRPDVMTVVIAQGAGADWLRETAGKLSLKSLRILPFQPYERHAEILASSDVLVTLLDSECGSFAVPSKLLAYMCAARPLLVAAPPGNLASRIVRCADAGLAAPATTVGFLEAADKLLSDPGRLPEYSANARAYAEKTFYIDHICEEFLDVIAYAVRGGREVETEVSPSQQVMKPLRGVNGVDSERLSPLVADNFQLRRVK
jgi:colanic acid biosynthesis glycosyl transferase WcaI